MSESGKPLLGICGPTASGKSALGIELCKRLDGEVINVDSGQVYAGFDKGTAKLSLSEREGIPHHCIDIFQPTTRGNVADYLTLADRAIKDIHARNKEGVLVGGTGLYLTALLHGLAELPASDPKLREELESQTDEDLYKDLSERDALSASRIHRNDKVRIVRALETFYLTGTPHSALHAEHNFTHKPVKALLIVLCLPREELYQRINDRAEQMVNTGLCEEVSALREKYGDNLPGFDLLGYRQALESLLGQYPKSELSDRIAMYTRRFAKRQMTYWRNEPPKRGWITHPAPGQGTPLEPEGKVVPARRAEETKSFTVTRSTVDELSERIRARLKGHFATNEVWYLAISD